MRVQAAIRHHIVYNNEAQETYKKEMINIKMSMFRLINVILIQNYKPPKNRSSVSSNYAIEYITNIFTIQINIL